MARLVEKASEQHSHIDKSIEPSSWPDAKSHMSGVHDVVHPAPKRGEDLLKLLLDETKNPQERLAAVKSLVRKDGELQLVVEDKNGRKHRLRLETEKTSGSNKMVHLFEEESSGKERVLLRGISQGEHFVQEKSNGKTVSFCPENLGTGFAPETLAGSNSSNRIESNQSLSSDTALLGDVQISTAGATARGTAYFPDASALEGGFHDKQGKPLYTLEQYLAGEAPYVSAAMDDKAGIKYGQAVRIPELEKKYGRKIECRVVDTGGAFRGKGTSRIDICVADSKAADNPTINGNLTLRFI